MENQHHEQFFRLLRLSLGLVQHEDIQATAEDWQWLYQEADRQSLTGVTYRAVAQLPAGQQLPTMLSLQWMGDAECIKGLNKLLNQESARLTQLFDHVGRRTAILKGQANARLYPDKLSRQPGDIDIWVEGGRESVLALLKTDAFVSMTGNKKINPSYHHVHLPANEQGVVVEVHFRPSSGNFNPFTNHRLQRWLEEEIRYATMVEEGFSVPSMKFALMMQLAHVQRHFLASGIGLRHIVDYYWLLRKATDEDRQTVKALLRAFGLHQTAGALMWVLCEVLLLDRELMLCEPDDCLGRMLLREIMEGGNFGHYAQRQQTDSDVTFFLRKIRHQMELFPFAPSEMIWQEMKYIKGLFKRLPERIRHGRLSLRDFPE